MLTCYYKGEWAPAGESRPLFENSGVNRLAAATSKLALAGDSLLRLKTGSFFIIRWTSFKELTDLSVVERFLERVSP